MSKYNSGASRSAANGSGTRQPVPAKCSATRLLGIPEDAVTGPAELAVGSVQLALMSGVLVQWLLDPARAPDERMIADGVLGLAGHITDGHPSPAG